MRIVSVNRGKAEHIDGHKALTGINKLPVTGQVEVGPYGVIDDAIMDQKHHGGLDQAIYLYGRPDYAFFEAQLGRALPIGLFGENLTVEGLESARMHIGDRLEIGDVVLEVTSPRNPCSTFAARMHDPHWVKTFFAAGRPGIYGRVLKTGSIEAGMPVSHIPFAGEPIPVTELMRDYKNPSADRMRWLLRAPLHRDLRTQYEAALAQGSLL